MLLLIHGGPDWQFQYQLFDEAQVYASRYAVVLANPRGSAGYGETHARAIRGRIGTIDADDLIALFDAAAARPDIDATRAGVLGGSYGGLMTAWLAAHHGKRFRAAICERGVYAWDSLYGTSDIGHGMTSMVGTDPATWPAQTPLAYADQHQHPGADPALGGRPARAVRAGAALLRRATRAARAGRACGISRRGPRRLAQRPAGAPDRKI